MSIQQDSYLRKGQELETYISNGNRCKCVIFKDNIPENVCIYILTTRFILYYQRNQHLSLLLKVIINLENLIMISNFSIIQKPL